MLSLSAIHRRGILTAFLALNCIPQLYAQSGWSYYNTGSVNYGTLGQESTATLPGARTYANTSLDINGNFLLFGGTISGGGPTDSLFRYNLSSNRWSWIKGNNITGSPGSYGTMGVASPTNSPPNRQQAVSWTDGDNNFWIYGGWKSGPSPQGHKGDVWKFDTSTDQWTWVKGSAGINPFANWGTIGVTHPDNDPGGRYQSSSWKDAQGNFWIFSGLTSIAENLSTTPNDLWKFNGTNWTWVKGTKYPTSPVYGTRGQEAAENNPSGELLSNTWADSSGYLWLFGGTTPADLMWRYNPATNNWAWMAGSRFSTPANHGTKGIPAASNTPGGRRSAGTWIDGDNNLWLYGGWDGTTTKAYSDLWKFDTNTLIWTWIDGSDQPNLPPVLGTQGIPAPENTPGGVTNTVTWKDSTGNFWLHANGTLWKYTFPQSGIDWEQVLQASPE